LLSWRIAAVICSGVNIKDEAAAGAIGSGEVETTNAAVVARGGGRVVLVGGGGIVVEGEPDIADTRLIGLWILLGLLRRL
jgi:hypothetical protein